MQKTIRILMLLAVTMLAGSGVWAQDGPSNDPSNGGGDPLGMIYYEDDDAAVTTAGGLLEFYNNATCKDSYDDGLHQFSARENVPAEWLDAERTVYIKATPNAGHKLGAADAETHAVTFITVTEGAPVMNPNGARQMSRAAGALKARTRADGDAIAVTLVRTDGQAGIYKFQMPAAVNGIASDVTVTAAFPEHTVAKLGDTGYEHITFIDYETDAQTGTLTAVSRSTADLKDANNQPVPVYVLDGTETTLGTAGTSESPTEAWYVCLTPPTDANDNKGLVYGSNGDTYGLRLANYCHVHLILADGSMMTVGGESSFCGIVGSNFTIYGQGGTDNAGHSAEGVLNVSSLYEAMIIHGDLTINGGQVNVASRNVKAFEIEGGDIGIHGGIVNASSSNPNYSAIYASGGDIAITGGSVICTSSYIFCNYDGSSGGHLTISGGKVNASHNTSGIDADKSLIISGGEVEAYGIYSIEDVTISGGVVKLTSDVYGIHSDEHSVTISGGQVETPLIKAQKDISLGWTAASDYIKAGSFTTTSGVVKTAGKRFVALDESAGEGLPTAKAIVPANATAGGGFALSDIAGQTLRPVDGYLLGLCPGLGLETVFRTSGIDNLESNPWTLEFTMAGDKTTHYYIYKKNDLLVLSVGVVNDGFNGTDYNSAHVEILQENPTDPTAMPTACTEFSEDAHTMNMPARDLKIVAYRAYKKGVNYLLDGSAKNYSSVEKAYIIDGHDHTLYGVNGGWYVLLATADDTKCWMNDGDGNLMLTADGNMFECRGDVNIILADGSALSVGTKRNPFTGGSAVIYGDGNLNFYTQSVPTEKDGDKRGRMEFITDNGKAIEASSFLELRNVKLKAQGSPGSNGLVTSNNRICIIGGQIDVNAGNANSYAFYTNRWIELDWMLSFDEIFGSKYYAGSVKILNDKTFVNLEDKSEKFSGTVTTPSNLDGKTLVGQVIYDLTRGGGPSPTPDPDPAPSPSPTPPTSVDYAAISGSGGPMVVDDDNVVVAAVNRVDKNGTVILVGLEGKNENNVVVNGNTIPGWLQRLIDQTIQSAFRHPQHAFVVTNRVNLSNPVSSASNLIVGGEVTANGNITLTSGDGKITITGKTNAGSGEISIGGGDSGGGNEHSHVEEQAMIPTFITASGTGADADFQAQCDLAGAIYDKVSMKTFVSGNGANTNGELAAMGVEAEILKLIDAMKAAKSKFLNALAADNNKEAEAARQQFRILAYEYMQKTKHTISQEPMEVDLDALPELAPAIAALATNQPLGSDATVRGREYYDSNSDSWLWTGADGSENVVSIEGGSVPVFVGGGSRTRASGGSQLTMTFVPVPYDKDKVLPKGEIRLFMTKAELLSIAIYQREHPDEVKKARARGALMIDTTTPETTAIIGRLMVTERAQPVDGHWYGLDGRRLPSAPTAKGVYVHRGRKVVIR